MSKSKKTPTLSNKKYFVIFGVILILLLSVILGIKYLNPKESQSSQENEAQMMDFETVISQIKSTYGQDIPWGQLNDREAYQFYPKELNGLTLASDEVSTSYDNNYNPITTIQFGEGISLPVKNAYISYYEIPDVLSERYEVSKDDIVFPVSLTVYEFDRRLTEEEMNAFSTGQAFQCNNEESETRTSMYQDENLVVFSCDANLTSEQRDQLDNKDFFDKKEVMYLTERNMLLELGFNTSHIDNSEIFVEDYLTKLFNSNINLFVDPSNIRSIEDARKFEEWRSEMFDK